MSDVIVRIKDPSLSVQNVASWIIHITNYFLTPSQALHIARCLKRGEEWTLPANSFHHLRENEIATFELIKTETEDEKFYREQYEHFEFLRKGAEGDPEAAIEYCRREIAGLVNHSPIG